MSSAAPQVFDRALTRRHLARAAGLAKPGADFLLARAAEDLADRLLPVMRDFPLAYDLATPGDHAARVLAAQGRIGQVIRMAPVAGLTGDLVGDLEALPIAEGRASLIVSLLALQSVNDLPGAFIQIRRALKPDGLFLGCLLAGQSLNELRTALAAAEEEILGGASPRVAPFADLRDLGGLLQRAGFALPVTDIDPLTVRYSHMFALLQDLRAMGAANALAHRLRKPTPRAVFLRAAEIYAERFADPDGRIRATFELVWLSGWAPHESQQQPLRPGSAKARLADALRPPERQ
ncbi:methyltransferase domain-containing protein [Methylovirgula sp. 4M-Z18]|uniref:methyltransferase domain-containing protein n=1 Tax=Methylovirgula sp. 4M-Z18 TaxID=2293567 RepID=UPI000E2F6D86|nr:methyltransferase domain-containing protein [Methylovirgula sp. 4M-Z18]RFB81305.1 methyltransferase domain-containing protein [Methylovirgula sp. 4M-Z18]